MSEEKKRSQRAGRSDESDYEVGYGRPPAEHRFRKGQPTRNPRGRPRRKASNFIDLLNEPVSLKIQGRTRKVPYKEAFVQVIKERALRGDLRSSQILLMIMKDLGLLAMEKLPEEYEFTLRLPNGKPPFYPKDDSKKEPEGDK
jgi:hypothetical protein